MQENRLAYVKIEKACHKRCRHENLLMNKGTSKLRMDLFDKKQYFQPSKIRMFRKRRLWIFSRSVEDRAMCSFTLTDVCLPHFKTGSSMR